LLDDSAEWRIPHSFLSRRSTLSGMTIRSQLILLAIGAALPVLAFAILLSIVLVEQDRMTVQRGATDQARALPDVDGYEVARRIRSQSSRPIALIALTGYGEPADQRRALAAGFDLHLVKPITVERLDQAIATFGASPATLIAAG